MKGLQDIHSVCGPDNIFTMEISSDKHQVVFSLMKAAPSMAKLEIVQGAGGVKHWSGRLTMTGDYIVTVLTPDREANSHFKLRVTLR